MLRVWISWLTVSAMLLVCIGEGFVCYLRVAGFPVNFRSVFTSRLLFRGLLDAGVCLPFAFMVVL